MNEQKSEKKVVSRTVAIALGIICLILAVSLVGAIADYTSIISGKSPQISSLQNQVNNLTGIVNLSQWKRWVLNQPVNLSGSGDMAWVFSASYAGYVEIIVQPSNETKLYFQVIYQSYAGYNVQIINPTVDVETFPILPSTNIQILVGTNNPTGMTGNVTITYYY